MKSRASAVFDKSGKLGVAAPNVFIRGNVKGICA
jgi:hypothetical protein